MATQQSDDSRMSQDVDDLLGQLKSHTSGPAIRSKPRIVASPSGVVVGSGVARNHHPWPKSLLVASLGVGLVFWPYAHGCGLGLTSYFAALGVLLVTAVWALNAAWRQHTVWAYGLGLAIVVWGAGLSLVQVLPRVGYARNTAFWSCQAGMAPPPAAPVDAAPAAEPLPAADVPLGDLPPRF
jgi:hypothetical protein